MLSEWTAKLRGIVRTISKIRRSKWNTLSTGEKVLKVVLWLIKIGLIVLIGSVALTIIVSIWLACDIMHGLTDAIEGQIYRDYEYYHNRRYW